MDSYPPDVLQEPEGLALLVGLGPKWERITLQRFDDPLADPTFPVHSVPILLIFYLIK